MADQPPEIFVSHRHDCDSRSLTTTISDRLISHFGPGAVFVDYSSLHPGATWRSEIQSALEASSVVLVMIGKNWAGRPKADSDDVLPRLSNVDDWVRKELDGAFATDREGGGERLVIPVLLDRATIPQEKIICESLNLLRDRQTFKVGHFEHQDVDIRTLIEFIEQRVAPRPAVRNSEASTVTASSGGLQDEQQQAPKVGLGEIENLLLSLEVEKRTVRFFDRYDVVEPVVTDGSQKPARMAINQLDPVDAHDAYSILLSGSDGPTSADDLRARTAFALTCLAASGPYITDRTLNLVVRSIIKVMNDDDGVATEPTSSLDHGLAAIGLTSLEGRLSRQLAAAYLDSAHENDRPIIRLLLMTLRRHQVDDLTPETASATVAAACRALGGTDPIARLIAAFDLAEQGFRAAGKLAWLPVEDQQRLLTALVESAESHTETGSAACFALKWLTGAVAQRSYRAGQIELPVALAERVLALVSTDGADLVMLGEGLLSLTRQSGVTPALDQQDWELLLSQIADATRERRSLPPVVPSRLDLPHMLVSRLTFDPDSGVDRRLALATAATGHLDHRMVPALAHVATDRRTPLEGRFEAALYLAMIGSSDAARVLVDLATTEPEGEDDSRFAAGTLGLIYLDQARFLTQAIDRAPSSAGVSALAWCLATGNDPDGPARLQALSTSPDRRVAASARWALRAAPRRTARGG